MLNRVQSVFKCLKLILQREEEGAQQGQLPPENLFPSTLKALRVLKKDDLIDLETFYGIEFGREGEAMPTRREKFLEYIR